MRIETVAPIGNWLHRGLPVRSTLSRRTRTSNVQLPTFTEHGPGKLNVGRRSSRERVQFEFAKENVKSFRFQKYFPGRWKGGVAFIHNRAVDDHGNAVAVANAFDTGPFVTEKT